MRTFRLISCFVFALGCQRAGVMNDDTGSDSGGLTDEMSLVDVSIVYPDTYRPNLNQVWGLSGRNVYAVGQGGTILHLSNDVWSFETSTVSEDLMSVWGTSDEEMFAVSIDGSILKRGLDGFWRSERIAKKGPLRGVSGGGSRFLAVGADGLILERTSMGIWTVMPSDTVETLYAVDVSTDGRRAIAVGNLGTIVRMNGDGRTWSRQRLAGQTSLLHSVWGDDELMNLYVVGLDGTILKGEGNRFNDMPNAPRVFLRDAFAVDDRVYVVGWGGTYFKTQQDQVLTSTLAEQVRLESVWAVREDLSSELSPQSTIKVFVTGVNGKLAVGQKSF